jgi:hypothetical protein
LRTVSVIGVAAAGATALTRIADDASSRAADLVIATTAPFAAA